VNGEPLAAPAAAAAVVVELPAAALVALDDALELDVDELEPQAPMASATAATDNESATPRALMNEPRIYSPPFVGLSRHAPSRCVLTGSDDFLPTVWYTLAAVSAAVKTSVKFP
jgi:hypothetical protein